MNTTSWLSPAARARRIAARVRNWVARHEGAARARPKTLRFIASALVGFAAAFLMVLVAVCLGGTVHLIDVKPVSNWLVLGMLTTATAAAAMLVRSSSGRGI